MINIHLENINFLKKSLINYINDYKENHLITDFTKNECIALVENTNTIDELNELVNKVEKIIQSESKKIEEEKEKIMFNIKKEEYLNYLRENIYIIERIKDSGDAPLKILLNPMNEEELKYANKYIRFIIELNNINSWNVKDLDVKKSTYVDYLVDKYNSYINNTKIDEEKYESIDRKSQLVYEYYYFMFNGIYELREEFSQKTKVDLDDEIEEERFDLCKSILDDEIKSLNALYNKNIEYLDKFHEIYQNNIDKEKIKGR